MDEIVCADSRQMVDVPDESVQLVVTSPPYNVGKAYANHSDDLPLADYLRFLNEVWRECYRVLAPGGRLCINVANTDRKPYLPLNALITAEILRTAREEGLNWLMRGEIIWDKGSSVGVSTAWGSFANSSDPVLRDVHEYIMVFSKDSFKLRGGGKTGISGGQFVDSTRSIWRPEEIGDQGPEARRLEAQNAESQSTEDQRCGVGLEELQRKLASKLKDARKRGKDDAWIAESMARAAWQYLSRPGDGVWAMTTESRVGHPAPFPVELPRRLIELYTKPGDLVLDPFMGAGATAVAAVQAGRHYVGYDISPEYCDMARQRVAAAEATLSAQEKANQ
ncbi:MAG: site-specific DNA-methyltransferase [Caldilineales bacterium]